MNTSIPLTALDVVVFQLTAREVAEQDEDLVYEYLQRHEFRLAAMNVHNRDAMFEAMIKNESIKGGWFWAVTLGDSSVYGPFETREAALEDARQTLEE